MPIGRFEGGPRSMLGEGVFGRRWHTVRCRIELTKDHEEPTSAGFTLLELMIVLTLLLILASFAVPSYELAIQRAREAVLRDDLTTMRKCIDEFTVDKQRPPESLQELVDAGYLRGGVPVDPMTGSNETWQVDIEEVPLLDSEQTQAGVVDVHSGSQATALDGTTTYNTW
jgi:general secretion pathway protein G